MLVLQYRESPELVYPCHLHRNKLGLELCSRNNAFQHTQNIFPVQRPQCTSIHKEVGHMALFGGAKLSLFKNKLTSCVVLLFTAA